MAVSEPKTRKPSLSVMLATLKSKGVTDATFHENGVLASVSFAPPVVREQPAKPERERPIEFVPGTSIPADKSPLNPLDTLLNVPQFNANEVS